MENTEKLRHRSPLPPNFLISYFFETNFRESGESINPPARKYLSFGTRGCATTDRQMVLSPRVPFLKLAGVIIAAKRKHAVFSPRKVKKKSVRSRSVDHLEKKDSGRFFRRPIMRPKRLGERYCAGEKT